MWLFTKHGFLSVVLDREDPNLVVVRARKREHLAALLPKKTILETVHSDYRFRTVIYKDTFAALVASWVRNIDYDNYKNSIEDEDLHRPAAQVWGVMKNYQEGLYGRN